MNLAERKRKFRQTGYWCSLEISEIGFVSVFLYLLVLVMISAGPMIIPPMGGVSVELPQTPHAVKMPGVLREDAIVIAIMRDGTIYCGADKVTSDQVAEWIRYQAQLASERKVYIKADLRTKYGNVNEILDAIRGSGIEHIAFITKRPHEFVEP